MPTETLSQPAPSLEQTPREQLARFRYRLRFAKVDNLRLVSHHDLMHVVERMMRRAELPFAVTQGFHPQPKMSFALSLALGVIGRNEVFDVEMTRDIEPDDLVARLNKHAPAGLSFTAIKRCEKKLSSQVRRTFYRLIRGDKLPSLSASDQDDASHAVDGQARKLVPTEALANFLSLSEYWITRTRPQPRRLNIRPFVCDLTADDESLSMSLWVTPQGAARPEEIVHALGLDSLLDEGAILERTHLELLDEVPEHERFVPDLAAAATSAPANETQPPNDRPSRDERAPQHTSLIANPLSFDS